MPIATFGNKIFQVSSNKIYTFSGLSWSSSLETEAQEKLQSKPSTYIKGENLTNLAFEIQLRAELGVNVRAEIENWEAIKSSAQPSLFILGSKAIGKNKWLLKSVDVSDTDIDSSGRVLKATLKLSLEEYVRAGSAAASNNTIGIDQSSILPNNLFDSPEKANNKRYNPNLTNLSLVSSEVKLEELSKLMG